MVIPYAICTVLSLLWFKESILFVCERYEIKRCVQLLLKIAKINRKKIDNHIEKVLTKCVEIMRIVKKMPT